MSTLPTIDISIIFAAIPPKLLFADTSYIGRMNLDGSMVDATPHDLHVHTFDIDTVDKMLYYYDRDDDNIKRAPLDQDTPETIYTHDGLYPDGIAVDWIGRYTCCTLLVGLYRLCLTIACTQPQSYRLSTSFDIKYTPTRGKVQIQWAQFWHQKNNGCLVGCKLFIRL